MTSIGVDDILKDAPHNFKRDVWINLLRDWVEGDVKIVSLRTDRPVLMKDKLIAASNDYDLGLVPRYIVVARNVKDRVCRFEDDELMDKCLRLLKTRDEL